MTTPNAKLSERIALVGVRSPGTANSTETYSGYVPLAQYGQLLIAVSLGDMANEAIDVTVYQATSASGGNEKTLKAAAQLSASASANDNKQILINVRAEELDRANNFTHIRVGIKTGNTTGGPAAIVILAGDTRYNPATHLTSVVQVVD